MKSVVNGFAGQEARRLRSSLYARVTPVMLCFGVMVAIQSQAEPLTTLDALFTLIDGTPMPRREIGAQNAERAGGRY